MGPHASQRGRWPQRSRGRSLPHAALMLAGAASVAGCGTDAPAGGRLPRVETTVLAGPPGGESIFEPHVALSDDGLVVVAGQYGSGYNRGGLRFWAAERRQNGAWHESEAVPQPMTAHPTMAADATVAVGPDGTRYLLGLSADSTRVGVPDASLVLASAPAGAPGFSHRRTLVQVEEPAPDVLTATDKPWMAVDPDTAGGPAGTLYFGWTALTVHLGREPIQIERTLRVATSRDGGETVEPPVDVAPEGMGVQLAVRPDGTLDVVWTEVRGQGAQPPTRLLHSVSRDRGRTFSEPVALVSLTEAGPESLGHPTLAAGGDGSLMACWPQGPGEAAGWTVQCSHFRGNTGWRPAFVPQPDLEAMAVSFPALAASGGRWWLTTYVATADSLAVALFQGHGDGRTWQRVETLAAAAIPFASYCPAPGLPCRRDETRFFPGDYVSAAGRGSVVAVAWVLPASSPRGAGVSEGRLGVSVIRPGEG